MHAQGEADDPIAALAEKHNQMVVVTADRELTDRAHASNVTVVRPSWLLDQLLD